MFVGPASSCRSEQMKVLSSTRATSPGSETQRKLSGRICGLSRVKVPCPTRRSVRRSHSGYEPSHHTM